jgi:hypothetical protein
MLAQMPRHLLDLVTQAEPIFATFTPAHWNTARGEGKWTNLQLLGHLLDSASNNHQRFVRALSEPRLHFPGYDQIAHVAVQNYAAADPAILIALWSAYNRHISHVIKQITFDKASTPCTIDSAPEMSLADLALDYVAHLEHHLKQLLVGHSIKYSDMPWPPSDPSRQWPI